MKIKAKTAFFTDDFRCIGASEIVDINEKLAYKLIEIGYASVVDDDIQEEIKVKKSTTRKKKMEV